MRTLAITQNMTLDGSVEMLGSWFDPQAMATDDNSDMVEENHRQDAAADALVCGRRTFTDLRGYWRDLADDDTGVSDYLNSIDKYVVSSTLGDPEWSGTTVVDTDPMTAIADLKDRPGRDIVVTGSITLCHALIAADLVDEYRIYLYPSVQGGGRRLFPEGHDQPRLVVLDSIRFRSGIHLLTYRSH
ncbi:dihydrofolate reductase family protein [Aeromicrobium sp. CF3.5]|uniref:dihydrofolate reductase family protein n=1 Tax=Aeromicrobium sp. CF3.5 TaxID=3373078 RepID=UPI003EE762A7